MAVDSLHQKMGNCSLKGSTATYHSIRLVTDSGALLHLKAPKTVGQVLQNNPGYGVFRQSHPSSPLPEQETLSSALFYYLLPLPENDVSEEVEKLEGSERDWMSEKSRESSSSPSEYVENLSNGSALEVLPSARDGVWRVKLVIDTRQLEEILSEQVNTEALIEKMRIAAAATSSVSSPSRRRTNIISPWKVPSLFSTSRLPTNNGKIMKSTSAAVESIQLNSC